MSPIVSIPRDVNSLIRGGKATPRTATATNLLQLLIIQNSNLYAFSFVLAISTHVLVSG
jgi:hypothetical protein